MATMTDLQLPVAGRCRLEPATTTIEFATRHLFGLAPVRGTMAMLAGAVDIDAGLVQVELDAASFATGNPRRDNAVRGRRHLHTDAYPTLTFAGELAGGDGLNGTLTVRGVMQPVRLQITRIVPDGDAVEVDAVARIDRFACGIAASRGLAARYLRVSVHTRAVRE